MGVRSTGSWVGVLRCGAACPGGGVCGGVGVRCTGFSDQIHSPSFGSSGGGAFGGLGTKSAGGGGALRGGGGALYLIGEGCGCGCGSGLLWPALSSRWLPSSPGCCRSSRGCGSDAGNWGSWSGSGSSCGGHVPAALQVARVTTEGWEILPSASLRCRKPVGPRLGRLGCGSLLHGAGLVSSCLSGLCSCLALVSSVGLSGLGACHH